MCHLTAVIAILRRFLILAARIVGQILGESSRIAGFFGFRKLKITNVVPCLSGILGIRINPHKIAESCFGILLQCLLINQMATLGFRLVGISGVSPLIHVDKQLIGRDAMRRLGILAQLGTEGVHADCNGGIIDMCFVQFRPAFGIQLQILIIDTYHRLISPIGIMPLVGTG